MPMASRGGRSNGSWQISRIVQNISWDAGLIVKQVFRGMHKPQKKTKRKPTEFVRFIYKVRSLTRNFGLNFEFLYIIGVS